MAGVEPQALPVRGGIAPDWAIPAGVAPKTVGLVVDLTLMGSPPVQVQGFACPEPGRAPDMRLLVRVTPDLGDGDGCALSRMVACRLRVSPGSATAMAEVVQKTKDTARLLEEVRATRSTPRWVPVSGLLPGAPAGVHYVLYDMELYIGPLHEGVQQWWAQRGRGAHRVSGVYCGELSDLQGPSWVDIVTKARALLTAQMQQPPAVPQEAPPLSLPFVNKDFAWVSLGPGIFALVGSWQGLRIEIRPEEGTWEAQPQGNLRPDLGDFRVKGAHPALRATWAMLSQTGMTAAARDQGVRQMADALREIKESILQNVAWHLRYIEGQAGVAGSGQEVEEMAVFRGALPDWARTTVRPEWFWVPSPLYDVSFGSQREGILATTLIEPACTIEAFFFYVMGRGGWWVGRVLDADGQCLWRGCSQVRDGYPYNVGRLRDAMGAVLDKAEEERALWESISRREDMTETKDTRPGSEAGTRKAVGGALVRGAQVGTAKQLAMKVVEKLEEKMGERWPEELRNPVARQGLALLLVGTFHHVSTSYPEHIPYARTMEGWSLLAAEGIGVDAMSGLIDQVFPLLGWIANMVQEEAGKMGLLSEAGETGEALNLARERASLG